MSIESIYWFTRKTVERTIGEVMFGVGNKLALAGIERFGEPLVEKGGHLRFVASIPHSRVRVNQPDQTYFWTPEWQADKREADEDMRTLRMKSFSSPEAAVDYLRQKYMDDPSPQPLQM